MLQALNPDVTVITYQELLHSSNIFDIIKQYDVVVDGCDNFPTRYLVNDACVMANIPNVHGSVFRFEGQATVFKPHEGPCYRCLYPEPPPPGMVPSCQEGGVLGVLPGIIGTIQAIEAIKLILDIGKPLIGRVPGIAGAYVATGHGPWGMLNAPATGLALAEQIVDGRAGSVDLAPFDPARLPGSRRAR